MSLAFWLSPQYHWRSHAYPFEHYEKATRFCEMAQKELGRLGIKPAF
ncbi:hypothetical protein [Nostoc sp. DSM 114159]